MENFPRPNPKSFFIVLLLAICAIVITAYGLMEQSTILYVFGLLALLILGAWGYLTLIRLCGTTRAMGSDMRSSVFANLLEVYKGELTEKKAVQGSVF